MVNVFLVYIAATFYIQHVTFTEAFTTPLAGTRSSFLSNSMTRVYISSGSLFGDDDFSDIEAARRQFESLVEAGGELFDEQDEQNNVEDRLSTTVLLSSGSDASSSLPLPETPALDVKVPPRPPLTTIERERRSAEIALLGHLSDGDEVKTEIYNLWFSERGAKAAASLRKANDLMEEGPEDQREAELILRSLIEEYGVYFTEPVNRLATLYYVQGRLEEALTLNKIVLSIKPWHFGALSHIVMCYAALGNPVSARQWAAFRIPPVANNGGSNRRRIRWVERAVVDATILLHQGEKNNEMSFGQSDREWIAKQTLTFNDDDAWQ